ncbi:sensor histidine kinase [Corynebacterium lizhenjunii]|uniref:sensor histidine kinase n=1 Tax=Corynebacterium lizhenjunii TaxID=2709394 RepID=UPI0013EDB56E|nr:histidine kinase [Corynebacterium lizhenjunii]
MTVNPAGHAVPAVSADAAIPASPAFAHVLPALRWGLFAMFALLWGFGVTRARLDGSWDGLVLALATAFAVLLLAGVALRPGRWPGRRPGRQSGRWSGRRPGQAVPTGNATATVSPRRTWALRTILAALVLVWIGLMVHARDFMWLEFPLVFIVLRYVPRPANLLAVLALWAVAAFVPAWRYPETWTVAAAVGPAIGTAFAAAVYFGYVTIREEAARYKQLAHTLQRTQADLARTERRAGELAERERLSRELHDTVAQGLSSIVLLARAARQAPDPGAHLRSLEAVAQDSLNEARRFVREWSGAQSARTQSADAPLADAAYTPAVVLAHRLAQLVDAAQERARVLEAQQEIRLETMGDLEQALPSALVDTVDRVAREGLANAITHSGATTVVLSLGVFAGELTVDVVDNGRGLHATPQSVDAAGSVEDGAGAAALAPGAMSGFGLAGVRARVAEAGGKFSVESSSAAPTGTTLSASFPLPGATNVKEDA